MFGVFIPQFNDRSLKMLQNADRTFSLFFQTYSCEGYMPGILWFKFFNIINKYYIFGKFHKQNKRVDMRTFTVFLLTWGS